MIIMLCWLFKVEFTRIDQTSLFGVCRDIQVFFASAIKKQVTRINRMCFFYPFKIA